MSKVNPEFPLKYKYNYHFEPGEVPEELTESEYIKKGERSKISCPKDRCRSRCKVIETDEKKFLCRNGHTSDYNPAEQYYYELKTDTAISDLIDKLEESGTVSREATVSVLECPKFSLIIVPGPFSAQVLQNVSSQLRQARNVCVIAFDEEAQWKLKELVDRFGGLSMVLLPPNLPRKVSKFRSLIELRDDVETRFESVSGAIPNDIIEKIHDNPQYLIGELVDYEQIEKDSNERDRFEKLCNIAFSQIADFPLNSLGTEDRGKRVPDGFGFIFDDESDDDVLAVVDAKSVSSETRDHPNIDESDDAQYRIYLEKVKKIGRKYRNPHPVLVFVAPEFKLSKVRDFLKELSRSDISDFDVVLFEIEALVALLIYKHSLVFERKARLHEGEWRGLVRSLLTDPEYELDIDGHELKDLGGYHLTKSKVREHLHELVDEEQLLEEVLDDIQGKLREIEASL